LTRQHAGLEPERHQARSSGRGRGGGPSSAIRGKVSGSIFAKLLARLAIIIFPALKPLPRTQEFARAAAYRAAI